MCNFQIIFKELTDKKKQEKGNSRVETDLFVNIPLLNNFQCQDCPLR